MLTEVKTTIELIKLGLGDLKSLDPIFREDATIEEIRGLKEKYLIAVRLFSRAEEILSEEIENQPREKRQDTPPPFFLKREHGQNGEEIVIEAIRRLCELNDGVCNTREISECVDYTNSTVGMLLKKLLRQGKISKPARGYIAYKNAEESEA